MKLKTENRKKLSALRKALLIGIPVSTLIVSGCSADPQPPPQKTDEEKQSKAPVRSPDEMRYLSGVEPKKGYGR